MTPDGPVHGDVAFSEAHAARVRRFFERVLVHTKGRWAGSPFLLEPWQRDEIIDPIFGTLRYDAQWRRWVRSYSEAWLELARKNGKSEILAGIALYMLCADGEPSAEVYGAAVDRDQAAVVFNVARRMVELSPVLRRRLTVVPSTRTIVDPRTSSTYQVVPGDALGNLGLNPHCVVFDEVLTQAGGGLWDALRRGQGTREQALFCAATTAGSDPESFAAQEHAQSAARFDDPSIMPHRHVVIYAIPPDKDVFDEANWPLANPALGSFLSVETVRQEAAEAKANPTKEAAFRQFRGNQWVGAASRWLSVTEWADNGGPASAPDDLAGAECFGGLDLAATSDLAAFVLFFPSEAAVPGVDIDPADRHIVVPRFWAPESIIPTLDAYTSRAASQWVRRGLLEVVDGDVIDYDQIHTAILEAWNMYGLVDISVDRWNATSTITWAQREGITMIPMSQTFQALSPPSKELERMISARLINHGSNPVLAWNAASTEVKRDISDNIRPVKPNRYKSGKRIDGIVALIMAIDGWMRRGSARSAYEPDRVDAG